MMQLVRDQIALCYFSRHGNTRYLAPILYCVTIVPICTTSKLEPLIAFSVLSSLSSQRGSGAPLMYQFEPLSATIMPYFFSARRITCIRGEKPEISNDALSRTRMPIGGRFVLVLLLAKWRAGKT